MQLVFDAFSDAISHRRRLHEFELSYLNDLEKRLDKDASKLFNRQVAQINLVTRILKGRCVNLYHKRNGLLGFEQSDLFHNHNEEFLLATINLTRAQDTKKLSVKIWVTSGHLIELQYSEPPKEFFGVIFLSSIKPKSIQCKLHGNPQEQPSKVDKDQTLTHDSGKSVSAILQNRKLQALNPPPSQLNLSRKLDHFETSFPQDYLQILKYSNGCEADEWQIFGINDVRDVSSGGKSYVVIAEKISVGLLAVLRGSANGNIIFFDYIDDRREDLGSNIVDAMSRVDRQLR